MQSRKTGLEGKTDADFALSEMLIEEVVGLNLQLFASCRVSVRSTLGGWLSSVVCVVSCVSLHMHRFLMTALNFPFMELIGESLFTGERLGCPVEQSALGQ